MDNYDDVIHQMEAFGVKFRTGSRSDLPLQIPTLKRKTCGEKGKWWYWLQLFRPHSGGEFVVGRFGTYKHGGSDQKVDIDWKRLSDEDKNRMQAERQAAADAAAAAKAKAARLAALSAGELWSLLAKEGESAYLQRKGVSGESCRFVSKTMRLGRPDPRDPPLVLPPGTIALPLIRYDYPREEALRGLQFVKPDGFKIFTEGFGKTGCAIRLGQVDASTRVVLVCEGYATGLSIRLATGRRWPVYVALDAYNLAAVVEILRRLHPQQHLLVCADDDWKTADHDGTNPGRRKAWTVAKATERCDIVWPVFDAGRRQAKDTDYNDLHQRQGLEAVERQLLAVLGVIERRG